MPGVILGKDILIMIALFRNLFHSKRTLLLIVGCGSIGLLGVGYFLQYVIGLVPCPLCIIQRGFFLGVGITALIGAWHNHLLERYASVMCALALLGGGVAVRNVYIEHIPQGLGVQCIPWMESLTDAITLLFQATGDCSVRGWTLLGLSIPEWSLFSFICLVGISGWILWGKPSISTEA